MRPDGSELSSQQTEQLVEALLALGWTSEDGWLYAPHRTMWLSRAGPWRGGLLDFRDRMMGRLERIKNNRDSSDSQDPEAEKTISDVAGLSGLLERMSLPVGGGLEGFFAKAAGHPAKSWSPGESCPAISELSKRCRGRGCG